MHAHTHAHTHARTHTHTHTHTHSYTGRQCPSAQCSKNSACVQTERERRRAVFFLSLSHTHAHRPALPSPPFGPALLRRPVRFSTFSAIASLAGPLGSSAATAADSSATQASVPFSSIAPRAASPVAHGPAERRLAGGKGQHAGAAMGSAAKEREREREREGTADRPADYDTDLFLFLFSLWCRAISPTRPPGLRHASIAVPCTAYDSHTRRRSTAFSTAAHCHQSPRSPSQQ